MVCHLRILCFRLVTFAQITHPKIIRHFRPFGPRIFLGIGDLPVLIRRAELITNSTWTLSRRPSSAPTSSSEFEPSILHSVVSEARHTPVCPTYSSTMVPVSTTFRLCFLSICIFVILLLAEASCQACPKNIFITRRLGVCLSRFALA